MTCRVGMSTMPNSRIAYWKGKGYAGGEIIVSKLTYDQAQAREKQEASERGCISEPGGERVPGEVWSVYHVWE